MAKLRLQVLIAAAHSVHLINWDKPLEDGERRLATLLVDGRDVSAVALAEGWGLDYRSRKDIDWGDHMIPFFGMRRVETA
jgi:endonuclease YncB( thermonuclease family)